MVIHYGHPGHHEFENNEIYRHPASYLNIDGGNYEDYLDDYPLETRECMRYSLICFRLIMYTDYMSSPISEGFDTKSTQIHDKIGFCELEDDRHWPEPRFDVQMNDSFKCSSLEDSRNPVSLPTCMTSSYQNHGTDFRSTLSALNSHPSTASQTSNANGQEQIGFSLGYKPRNVHGIRLRPISDLRLSLKLSL